MGTKNDDGGARVFQIKYHVLNACSCVQYS